MELRHVSSHEYHPGSHFDCGARRDVRSLAGMAGSAARPETVTVVRRLSGAQAHRRVAARRAAADLAREGGYDAVTMAAVADRIGTARATIYRDFSSKDHLLAEVVQDWAAELDRDLHRRPPKGATLAERVAAAFDRLIEAALRDGGLTAALLLAATSADPAATASLRGWASPVAVYLRTLVGRAVVPDLAEITTVLGHVFFSALIDLVLRGQDPAEARAVMHTTVRLLLSGPRAGRRCGTPSAVSSPRSRERRSPRR